MRAYQPPPGLTLAEVVSDFDRRVMTQQPVNVVLAVGRDAVKLLAPARFTSPGDSPISRWQFQRGYPFYPSTVYGSPVTAQIVASAGRQFGGGDPMAVRPLASFLRAYQLGGGFTPGSLLAFAVLAGLAGTLSLVRHRATPAERDAERDAARACLLVSQPRWRSC